MIHSNFNRIQNEFRAPIDCLQNRTQTQTAENPAYLIVVDAVDVKFTTRVVVENVFARRRRATRQRLEQHSLHAAQAVAQLRRVHAQILGDVSHPSEVRLNVRQRIDERGQLRQRNGLRFLRQPVDHEVGRLCMSFNNKNASD